MHKSFFLLTGILAVSLMSCQGQQNENIKSTDNSATQENVSLTGSNKPVHINKAQFLELVMNYEENTENWMFEGDKPCVIDFYADWCAPCRITSPILDELAGKYAGKINIYKVDVDDEKELAAVFGIQSIPTFLFCPMDGQPTISSGIANTPAATKELFIKQIEEILLKNKEGSAS